MRVNVTIPVFNEGRGLRKNLTALHTFLTQHVSLDWEIIIANNGSTDHTLEIAQSLANALSRIRVVHLNEKGRGRALKQVWLEAEADILSYMDADLSTDLKAFPPLIEALVTERYDLATGSRLLNPSLTTRCFRREFTSRSYNLLVKALLRTRFSDAQCGFKAITRRTALNVLPLVEDKGWFFDTELLVVSEKIGYRVFDLPVRWVENQDSHVRVLPAAVEDLKGLVRVWWSLHCGKLSKARRPQSC